MRALKFLATAAVLVTVNASGWAAQYTSFSGVIQLPPGFGIQLRTDVLGNTYIAENAPLSQDSFLTKIAPDGSITYINNVYGNFALDDMGYIWAQGGAGLTRYDPSGQTVTSFDVYQGMVAVPIGAMGCDHNGNLYVAAGMTVLEFDPTGKKLASYTIPATGRIEAIAVDVSNVVYVAGKAIYRLGQQSFSFPTTAGAFEETLPGQSDYVFDEGPYQFDSGPAFVMKLAPGLQSAVFSTLLGGSSSSNATSLAVDAAGHVFVGGSGGVSFQDAPNLIPFPLTMQTPLLSLNPSDAEVAYVVELDPTGSSLLYSAGISTGAVQSLVLAPDGSVDAVAVTSGGAGVFTVSPDGSTIERQQFFYGAITDMPFFPSLGVALLPDGRLRVMANLDSAEFPAIEEDSDQPGAFLIDFPRNVVRPIFP